MNKGLEAGQGWRGARVCWRAVLEWMPAFPAPAGHTGPHARALAVLRLPSPEKGQMGKGKGAGEAVVGPLTCFKSRPPQPPAPLCSPRLRARAHEGRQRREERRGGQARGRLCSGTQGLAAPGLAETHSSCEQGRGGAGGGWVGVCADVPAGPRVPPEVRV